MPRKRSSISYLLNPKNWWLPLLLIFMISAAGVISIGVHTYTGAPPIPDYTSVKDKVVFSKDDIIKGQAVFQKYALMEYGSMFGDGANRGPDFTAEALHLISQYMKGHYQLELQDKANSRLLINGIEEQVKMELKANRYNPDNNQVSLTEGQVFAANELVRYYEEKFIDPNSIGAFKPAGYITNKSEIRSLTAFFFWGAWVCGVQRPGELYSYTHNWPYDPSAGNKASPAVILWSIIGSLGLILGLGLVLYFHGKLDKLDDQAYTKKAQPLMTRSEVQRFQPDAIQKATYKFFYAAIVLFAVQCIIAKNILFRLPFPEKNGQYS